MKILIVDDEEEFTETLLARFDERGLVTEHVIARSRESALDALNQHDFDFIICDLRIPTVDRALDADIVHGQAVYSVAREKVPGTPVLVLSGHGDEQIVADMAELAPHDDPFGASDPKPMLQYVPKRSDLEGCLTRVATATEHIAALQAIDLSPNPEYLILTAQVERVLRVFGRLRGGAVVRFQELGGGLTKSQVLRVRVEDKAGALAALAVAKIDLLAAVDDEVQRYGKDVVTLTPGIFTPLMMTVRAGAGRHGGAFYSLDEGFDRSLFDLLAANPDAAASAVSKLRAGTERWREGRPVAGVLVGDLRQVLCPDDRLDENVRAKLSGLPWEEVEALEVQARACPQHCDLHGLNVLVGPTEDPRMIDFGSVGAATAAVDPVTLELSILFHPASPDLGGDWPTPDHLRQWSNRPDYLADCPVAAYIEACRQWALDVSGSNAEFFATGYAYAVRQLTYPETNHEFALALISSCIQSLSS
jgi:CheY-like chemotaxis protein